jgi:hypothetical protein
MANLFAAGKSIYNLDFMIQADFTDDNGAILYLSDGRVITLNLEDSEALEERLVPSILPKD